MALVYISAAEMVTILNLPSSYPLPPYPNSPASDTSLNISTTVISSVSNPLSKCRDVFQTDYWNADLLYIL